MKKLAFLALTFCSFKIYAATRPNSANDNPILRLDLAPVNLSFAHWTLRDSNTPLLSEEKEPSIEKLEEIFDDAKERVESENKKNKINPSSLENLLTASTTLLEALEDIHLKRFKNIQLSNREQTLYESVKKEKVSVLNWLMKLSKNKEDTARYRFQLAALQPRSAESQIVFSQLMKDTHAEPSITRRAQSQLLINLLTRRELVSNKAKLKQVIASNKKLFENNSISTKIVLWLSATRASAGIVGRDIVSTPSPDWLKYLKKTLESTSGIDSSYRDQVVMDLLFVWRKVKSQATWLGTPIEDKFLEKLFIYPAILERRSLELYSKGKTLDSIKLTRVIEDRVEEKIAFRNRLLAWHNSLWQKTGKYDQYEAEIIRQLQLDRDQNRQKYAKEHYFALVTGQNKLVKRSPKTAGPTIALSDRFIDNTSPSSDLKASVLELTANAYLALNDHRLAARRFGLAAEAITQPGQKVRLYKAATVSQRKVAKWTEAPPWFQSMSHDLRPERETLQKFHSELLTLQPSSWADAAHIGLLYLNFMDENSAFKLWREQVKKYPSGIHSNNASWLMLTSYEKVKNWDDLESFARMLDSLKVNPSFRGKLLRSNDKLALSLFEGGMVSYQDKKFEKTITKLEEYVDRWARPDEDKALWTLSFSLNFSSRHLDAVKRCLDLVTRFKKSSYYLPANLQGFDWSEDMALENNMQIFANNFLGKEKNTSKAMALRKRLIHLYLGLERYGDVLSQLQEQQASYKANKLDDNELLYQVMDIQHRYGKLTNAIIAADTLLAKTKNPAQIAEALGIKGLNFAQKNDLKNLGKIEKQLADLKGEGFVFAQKRAKMRLKIAQSISTKFILDPVINISLKNPLQTLQTKFDTFNAYYQRMRVVCGPGQTGYCALALLNIRNVGRDFLKVVEEIKANPRLGDEDTKPFNDAKKDITSKINGYISSAEKEAYQIVTNGETDPATALEVMSSVSNDWNFEPITGSEGKGFVQLQVQKGVAR